MPFSSAHSPCLLTHPLIAGSPPPRVLQCATSTAPTSGWASPTPPPLPSCQLRCWAGGRSRRRRRRLPAPSSLQLLRLPAILAAAADRLHTVRARNLSRLMLAKPCVEQRRGGRVPAGSHEQTGTITADRLPLFLQPSPSSHQSYLSQRTPRPPSRHPPLPSPSLPPGCCSAGAHFQV